jgi:hypothetical protein
MTKTEYAEKILALTKSNMDLYSKMTKIIVEMNELSKQMFENQKEELLLLEKMFSDK